MTVKWLIDDFKWNFNLLNDIRIGIGKFERLFLSWNPIGCPMQYQYVSSFIFVQYMLHLYRYLYRCIYIQICIRFLYVSDILYFKSTCYLIVWNICINVYKLRVECVHNVVVRAGGSRRRSRRARLCRALTHSDSEVPLALQPRQVTAWPPWPPRPPLARVMHSHTFMLIQT